MFPTKEAFCLFNYIIAAKQSCYLFRPLFGPENTVVHYSWIMSEFKNGWLFGGLKNWNTLFMGVPRVLRLFEFN
jgi:hypothetical protein